MALLKKYNLSHIKQVTVTSVVKQWWAELCSCCNNRSRRHLPVAHWLHAASSLSPISSISVLSRIPVPEVGPFSVCSYGARTEVVNLYVLSPPDTTLYNRAATSLQPVISFQFSPDVQSQLLSAHLYDVYYKPCPCVRIADDLPLASSRHPLHVLVLWETFLLVSSAGSLAAHPRRRPGGEDTTRRGEV